MSCWNGCGRRVRRAAGTYLAVEREHVVLAEREDVDVSDDNLRQRWTPKGEMRRLLPLQTTEAIGSGLPELKLNSYYPSCFV